MVGDIFVTGGIDFVRSLFGKSLLDESTLLVHPVLLGNGRGLFDEAEQPTNLIPDEAIIYPSGAVRLTCRPA